MKIKLSIITVVLNSGHQLEKTIKSLIPLNFEYEFIVIDGGSTDNTLEVIYKYQKKINYFESKKDLGIYDAMNKGIKKSNGTWLYFLNAGDEIIINNFIYFYNYALKQNYKDSVVITGIVSMVDGSSNPIGRFFPNKEREIKDLVNGCNISHQASFINYKLFEMYGLYSLEYKYSGDYEFWLRIYKKNVLFILTNDIVANFNINGASSSFRLSKYRIEEDLRILYEHGYIGKSNYIIKLNIRLLVYYTKLIVKIIISKKIT